MTWLIFAMQILTVVVELAWVSILDIAGATDRIVIRASIVVTLFELLAVAARDLPLANVSLGDTSPPLLPGDF